MNRYTQIFFIIIVILCYIRFFEPTFLSQSLLNMSQFAGVTMAIFFSVPKIFSNHKKFSIPILILLGATFLSMFMAMFYWEQTLKDTFLSTYEHFIIIFFFFLVKSNLSIKDFEKIILAIGLLYLILFLIQFLYLPTIIFGKSHWGTEEFVERRGAIRFVFPSAGIFFLMASMSFVKLSQKNKNKWLYVILSIICFIVPFIQVTRQFILAILLIFTFHIISRSGWLTKIIIVLLVSVGTIALLNSNLDIVQGLIAQSKSDLAEGSDYIRIQAANFFLFNFSPNWITQIFGNGIPYWNNSIYGIYVALLQNDYGYYFEDVGIVGYYAQVGLFGVIGFIIIWYYSFKLPLPAKYRYLKYYLWFLLLTGLAWYSLYHYHYLIFTTITVAMYQKIILKNAK